MPPFNFPAAPTVDQIVQDPTTGAIYQWKTPAGGGAPYAWYCLSAGPTVLDPPLGGEYVRVGSLWRLKTQTLVLDGLNSIDIDVPATAKALRADATIRHATVNTNNGFGFRASVDGTNFVQGAADYYHGGIFHYTQTPTSINLAPGNDAYGWMTVSGGEPTNGVRSHLLLPVSKPAGTTVNWAGTVNAGYYHAANGYTDLQFTSALQGINVPAATTRFLKLRFANFDVPAGLFAAGSIVTCDWLY